MFAYAWRRSPLRLFAAVALSLLAINVLGGLVGGVVAAGVGATLLLPLLLFKIFILLMVFRFIMGGGPAIGRRGSRGSKREPQTKDEAEFREYVRRARQELDDLFPHE